MTENQIEITTKFSKDRKYRYMLVRDIDALTSAMGYAPLTVTFLMLNPSTADENTDDPTIKRCSDFAARWGYGRLIVVNLSPLRATDPQDLIAAGREPDEVAQRNMEHVIAAANESSRVILAYGAHGDEADRASYVVGRLWDAMPSKLYCLGYTHKGLPKHPLYIAKTKRPVPFTAPHE